MVYFLLFLVVLLVFVLLFININPAFGGNPSKKQKEQYSHLDNYVDGKFINPEPTKLNMSAADYFSMIEENFSGAKDRSPKGQIPVSKIDWNKVNSEEDSLTWFGHSTFLLSIDNKKMLVDPMLGPVASPVSFVGSKRYSEDMLHHIDEMPPIDAVFITHDHYDHLDYPSIKKLKNKVNHFFVPLGVGAHLIDWGVKNEKITELNWWDEIEFQGLIVAFTPSQHFSGRGPLNRNSTLWGGWVILGEKTRFYTSGDGGYNTHFKEIGRKYGPFDLTLIEGGQYDRRWSWVHMTPEQSIQAHLDVHGKNMMLIHWGAFTLAYHGWTEPIERALKASEKSGANMIAPKIGETVTVDGDLSIPTTSWWKKVK
ncbi:MBL fold metallo-hydrolase [Neobacillus drentensis]|nr:MBL fold metallo-hydrolase [Neobacillus drentensis]ULT59827.1 MBL fold metallo-hydrolase [Neobacillus drentensis]